MRNPLIHRGFFREMLRQLRAKGLVMSFILLAVNLIVFSSLLTRDPLTGGMASFDARSLAAPMLIALYIFTPIMVFGAYRWTTKRVQSDFYHAIPLTRTQIYATTSAAILFWLAIAIVSYAVVQVILLTVFGQPVNYLLTICVILNMLIASVEIVAAFSIGTALCGRRFTAFFQSVTVLFLPRVLLTAFWVLMEVDSGLTKPFSMLPFFVNPEFNIAATPAHSLIYGISFANIPAMLYSLVMSCGLLALGCVAFNKRKSELAELPYASKVLQTVTRVTFGMPSLTLIIVILNVYLAYGEDQDFLPAYMFTPLTVTAVIFSFLFYCLYELISSRKMKRVVKSMPAFGFCIALGVFFIFVPNWVGELNKPSTISANDVRSFRFSSESTLILPCGVLGSEAYPDYVLHHYTFTENDAKPVIENRSKEFCKDVEYDPMEGFLMNRIIVNDGFLSRKIIPQEGGNYFYSSYFRQDKILELCMKDKAFADKLYAYPKGMIWYSTQGLTNAEAREVGRLFREDYEKLSNAERASLINSSNSVLDSFYTATAMDLSIALYIAHGTENTYVIYRVNELTPNAAKAMLGYLNARNGEKTRAMLKDLVAWMEHPNRTGEFRNVTIGTYDLRRWQLMDGEGTTPKDAHPEIYQILKALSEAPLTDDPNHAVTVETSDTVDLYDLSSSSTYVKAGFYADDTLMSLIRQLIKDGVDVVFDSFTPTIDSI